MAHWIRALLIVLALAAALLPADSGTVERAYSTTVYPRIQRLLTPVSNMVPFAVFDVLTVVGLVALVVALGRGLRRAIAKRRVRPLLAALYRTTAVAATVYLVFLALWGFNYRRVPMAERLVLERGAPSNQQVMTLGFEAIQRMNRLHEEAHRAGWAADPRRNQSLLDAFAFAQRRLTGLESAVPGRLKRTIYGPYFRWTAVDGMVDPFALEVLANPDLLPFERTFIAAHEWAHLAGFADESEANFVAWLTCVRADAPSQYSGWLHLYWQIAAQVKPDDRPRLWEEMAEGPRRDVQAIADRLRRGQLPFLRRASVQVYDGYLRANRVEEGIRSYGLVIDLVLRARFEDGWVPVRRTSSDP